MGMDDLIRALKCVSTFWVFGLYALLHPVLWEIGNSQPEFAAAGYGAFAAAALVVVVLRVDDGSRLPAETALRQAAIEGSIWRARVAGMRMAAATVLQPSMLDWLATMLGVFAGVMAAWQMADSFNVGWLMLILVTIPAYAALLAGLVRAAHLGRQVKTDIANILRTASNP